MRELGDDLRRTYVAFEYDGYASAFVRIRNVHQASLFVKGEVGHDFWTVHDCILRSLTLKKSGHSEHFAN